MKEQTKEQECLINKFCVPCMGGVPPLTEDVVQRYLKELANKWALNKQGHLHREYIFTNFINSMNFANKIAELAEKEAHHPDLTIAWGKCVVEMWTHKINGLTESDFVLAAKIEKLAHDPF
ncbi:MAG: 4a-hydroxytetrahydrobiopterin dehydratase [Pseudomonadota bacterium]|jgi:4a-hydroxytetrahydrobiopterin dehydratase